VCDPNTGMCDLVIDGEIIEYKAIDTDPNDGVGLIISTRAKNQPNYDPHDHKTNSAIEHLYSPQIYNYQWGITNGGVAMWCQDVLEDRLSAAGFDYVYADGVHSPEANNDVYALGYSATVLHDAFDPNTIPLWLESSTWPMSYAYALDGVSGQIDYCYIDDDTSLKDEVDRNILGGGPNNLPGIVDLPGYMPGQLGSVPLNGCWCLDPNYSGFQATPDDVEYVLARSVAFGVAPSFAIWPGDMEAWADHDANLYLIAQYEDLRLNGGLRYTDEVKRAIQEDDPNQTDYMVFTNFDDPNSEKSLVPTALLEIAVDPNTSEPTDKVRGFITQHIIDPNNMGTKRYATIWPTSATARTLTLHDLEADDVRVQTYDGDDVTVSSEKDEIAWSVSQRQYIWLTKDLDPNDTWEKIFEDADVE
jgi:hypothetical protein